MTYKTVAHGSTTSIQFHNLSVQMKCAMKKNADIMLIMLKILF